MAKIRIMYYKPVWGKWIGLGISGWTKLWNWNTMSLSHVELWTPNEDGNFTRISPISPILYQYTGDMFTSTMGQTGGKNRNGDGVVLRPASEVLKHPERWWYQEVEVSEDDLELIRNHCKFRAQMGIGYDKKAILSFFFPWRFHDKNKDICSEAVWFELFRHELLSAMKIFSPRRMSKRIYDYCTGPISELKPLNKTS